MKISLVRNILEANESAAKENRRRLGRASVVAVNITSAPGSGKTSLLEATVPALGPERRSAVIVGRHSVASNRREQSEMYSGTSPGRRS